MKITNFISEQDLLDIKKKGIYKISTNVHKNQCYIGSTTRYFYLRWSQHLSDLRKNIHKNPILQNIVNKHGLKCLVFEIIETIENKEKILEREQYWIDLYDSYNKGFNCNPIARNSCGRKMKEETKELFYKEVSQYSLDGLYIKTFKSLKEASEITNTDYVTLSNACNLKTKSANNYQWRFGSNRNPITIIRIKGSLILDQYDLNNNFIRRFMSIKDAALYIGCNQNTLSYASAKEGRTSFGYIWKRINKTKI